MNIWVINATEPLPIDGARGRLLRSGILCNELVRRGHDVTWWASTFHHARKFQRFEETKILHPSERLKLVCLKGRVYEKHVSVGRLLNHIETGYRFYNLAKNEVRPDIILCSYPLIELALAATKLGKRWNVPVILDIRDLWPDIFEEQFNGWKKLFSVPVMFPFSWAARLSCRRAHGITGITPGLMDWGVKKAGRLATAHDRSFPHGYFRSDFSAGEQESAEVFWAERGIHSTDFIVSYFGAVNSRHEFDLVVEAGRLLSRRVKNLKIVICGNGDHLDRIRDLSQDVPGVIAPGWIAHLEMEVLASMATLGLAPYKSDFNYLESVPTKAIEYFSHGLPVVSSLKGRLEALLEAEHCGVTYENGSPESLAQTIVDLAADPERVREMRGNSLRLFEERYDARSVYGDMAQYLAEQVRDAGSDR